MARSNGSVTVNQSKIYTVKIEGNIILKNILNFLFKEIHSIWVNMIFAITTLFLSYLRILSGYFLTFDLIICIFCSVTVCVLILKRITYLFANKYQNKKRVKIWTNILSKKDIKPYIKKMYLNYPGATYLNYYNSIVQYLYQSGLITTPTNKIILPLRSSGHQVSFLLQPECKRILDRLNKNNINN